MECIKNGQNNVLLWFIVYFIAALVILIMLSLIMMRNISDNIKVKHSVHIIPQVNENEKLAFLNIYFEGGDRKYFDSYLEINRDVNVIQDYSAGSNATTILAMKNGRTFYRKYAFGKDAIKLQEQEEWLEKYKKDLPVCEIIKKENIDDVYFYDMEYISNAVSFFKFIHTVNVERSWLILKQVLDCLDLNLYSQNVRNIDADLMLKYIDQKVVENIKICLDWCKKMYPDIASKMTIIVNGVEYYNLDYYSKYLSREYLSKVFLNDNYSAMHGDLTIENIICIQGNEDNWYLIDPNGGNMHESPFLDLAKLLQSLHGKYEFLMMVKDVNISGNSVEYMFTGSEAYQNLYKEYKNYLFEKYSMAEVRSIYYHEAIHWLRLMPYKIRKNPHTAIVFYSGMLMILKDIEDMFER